MNTIQHPSTPGHEIDSTSVLRVQSLTKSFGGLTAIDNVDFEIEGGRVAALIGPNGAGKTTLLNVISGVLRANSGSVHLFDQEITQWQTKKIASSGLIRTFQLVHIFANMSVLENVLVGFHLQTRGGFWQAMFRSQWTKSQNAGILENGMELLELVGLAHRASERAGNLAFGDQRILEIARALAADPRVLLLDEPASGLGPSDTKELGDLILRLRDRGVTVLFIEHDMNLVMKIAEKVIVIDFGIKIAEGTPDEIQNNVDVLLAHLGTGAAPQTRVEPT